MPSGIQPASPFPTRHSRQLSERGDVTVVRRAGAGGDAVRRATVPAVRLPISHAIAPLTQARRSTDAHPASKAWGAATMVALQLIARGRLLPGVSAGGYDAWRVGPLDAADTERIQQVADALPPEARAVALPDTKPLTLPDAYQLVRDYIDAVADSLVRSPGAATLAGSPTYASPLPQQIPHLRPWAQESAAGLDAGVRISLRLVFPSTHDDFSSAVDLEGLQLVVSVHSLSDPSLVVDAADLWSRHHHGFEGRARIDVMIAVRRAARIWPPLARLGQQAVPDRIELDDGEVDALLGPTATRLAASGVEVRWPKELIRELTASAVVAKTERPPTDVRAFLSGDSVLSFDWQLALGDEPLTDAEMDALAASKRPVVRLRDKWLLVDPELVRKARDRRIASLSPLDALALALAGTAAVDDQSGQPVQVTASPWLEAIRQHIANPDDGGGDGPAEQPAALHATLRDYQLRGLRWLDRMTSLGLGGCLADDMGLGKTITLISLHLHRSTSTRSPRPDPRRLPGLPARQLAARDRAVRPRHRGPPLPRSHPHPRGRHPGLRPDDVRHDASGRRPPGRARPPWALRRRRRGAARQEPAVRHGQGAAHHPRRRPRRAHRHPGGEQPVRAVGDPRLDHARPARHAPHLPRALGPPDRGEPRRRRCPAAVPAGAAVPAASQEVRPRHRARAAPQDRDRPSRHAHHRSRSPSTRPSSARRWPRSRKRRHRPARAHHEAAHRLQADLQPPRAVPQGGARSAARPLRQARAARRAARHHHLRRRVGAGLHPVRRHGPAARAPPRESGVDSLFLHGGTTIKRRQEMVDAFQAGAVPVFLLSLKAAGTGLNLTRADHVIHYDRWWNPAVEDQATDRAYRIGQTRSVQVHRLIAEGTVEDRIADMIASKRELADAVLGSGEAALTELSDAELADLVSLRSSP